jgi:hypothetical protein
MVMGTVSFVTGCGEVGEKLGGVSVKRTQVPCRAVSLLRTAHILVEVSAANAYKSRLDFDLVLATGWPLDVVYYPDVCGSVSYCVCHQGDRAKYRPSLP